MASVPSVPSKEEKEKTLLELLAEERNLKRRRMSYRGKVHTKNKSYSEVLREVLNEQMKALQGWLGETSENTEEKEITVKSEEPVENENFIEVSIPPNVNPHTVWKSIDKYIENFDDLCKSDYDDEINSNRKQDSGDGVPTKVDPCDNFHPEDREHSYKSKRNYRDYERDRGNGDRSVRKHAYNNDGHCFREGDSKRSRYDYERLKIRDDSKRCYRDKNSEKYHDYRRSRPGGSQFFPSRRNSDDFTEVKRGRTQKEISFSDRRYKSSHGRETSGNHSSGSKSHKKKSKKSGKHKHKKHKKKKYSTESSSSSNSP